MYFGVQEGRFADLEVVARAAIEWVAVIREVASIVEPDAEFQIEFVQTEDGSLWLSNLLKAAKDGDRKALSAIVWGVFVFFAMGPLLQLQSDIGKSFGRRSVTKTLRSYLKKIKTILRKESLKGSQILRQASIALK